MNIIEIKKELKKYKDFDEVSIAYVSSTNEVFIEELISYSLHSVKKKCRLKKLMLNEIVGIKSNTLNFDYVILNLTPDLMIKNARYLCNKLNFNEFKEELASQYANVLSKFNCRKLFVMESAQNIFSTNSSEVTPYQELCETFNNLLRKSKDIVVIETNKLISKIGYQKAVFLRDYFRSNTLYTLDFMAEIISEIARRIRFDYGERNKVLCIDCDNTLWHGVVGEVGPNEVMVTQNEGTYDVFYEAQFVFKELKKQGILLALVTKNNPADIEEVFKKRLDFPLKIDDFVAIKANWNQKVESLQDLSDDLNLGLSSFVFVDDSDLECGLVLENLPEVKVIQVPKTLGDYPIALNEIKKLFPNSEVSIEDKSKTEMYQSEVKRSQHKKNLNFDEYIGNLNLELKVINDVEPNIKRTEQLFQKTNQFNFTTKRYTENEIRKMIKNADTEIRLFDLKDKFGDYGIIGLCVLKKIKDDYSLDSFLLSCRALGRNVEQTILKYVLNHFGKGNAINSKIIKNKKNIPAVEFAKNYAAKILQDNDEHMEIDFSLESKPLKKDTGVKVYE